MFRSFPSAEHNERWPKSYRGEFSHLRFQFPALRNPFLFCAVVTLISLGAALLLPKSYPLAFLSDILQMGLVAAAACLSWQNAARSHSNVRAFWLLIFLGTAMWLASLLIWSNFELVLRREVPDIPFGDILLFVKLVPLSAAIALQPHKSYDSRFRAFGLLDCLHLDRLFPLSICILGIRLSIGSWRRAHIRFSL